MGAPDVGGDRRAALRPGLPAGLPPHRQPARRRRPDPRRVHPCLPVAAQLPARHLRGLAAPHHDQRLPRQDASQAADPLRRALRRVRRPPAHQGGRPRGGLRRDPLRRRRAARPRRPVARTSARPSCCATSRGCPTRRSPRRSASSSAPCARASTVAAPSCARRSPTATPPSPAPLWTPTARPSPSAACRCSAGRCRDRGEPRHVGRYAGCGPRGGPWPLPRRPAHGLRRPGHGRRDPAAVGPSRRRLPVLPWGGGRRTPDADRPAVVGRLPGAR